MSTVACVCTHTETEDRIPVGSSEEGLLSGALSEFVSLRVSMVMDIFNPSAWEAKTSGHPSMGSRAAWSTKAVPG